MRKTLYEQDFRLWAEQIADLIAVGRFAELDHDSPSLKRYLTDESLHKVYVTARLDAIMETSLEMPITCPYMIGDVLERDISL